MASVMAGGILPMATGTGAVRAAAVALLPIAIATPKPLLLVQAPATGGRSKPLLLPPTIRVSGIAAAALLF